MEGSGRWFGFLGFLRKRNREFDWVGYRGLVEVSVIRIEGFVGWLGDVFFLRVVILFLKGVWR